MLDDLAKLISFKTVWDKPQKDAPYGVVTAQALDFVLQRAREYGLTAVNKGRYGYVDLEGTDGSGDVVGSLCHLDVVPEGDLSKWDTDPYELVINDGIMYGRGVTDNKGGGVAVLHALKRLKENGVQLKKGARLIFGCCEETDMSCVRAYVANEKMPVCCFVPDSDFPIINSEKGIIQVDIAIKANTIANNIDIVGGFKANMIPEFCSVVVKDKSPLHNKLLALTDDGLHALLPNNDEFEIFKNEQGIFEIKAKGVSGHAMAPHKGSNAILKMFALLSAVKVDGFDENQVLYKLNRLFANEQFKGEVGLLVDDEESGRLTTNPGLVKIDGDTLHLTVDARLPRTVNDKDFVALLKKGFERLEAKNVQISVLTYKPNLYISKEDPLIKTLLSIYTKHTGLEGYCIKSGGGTYARELKNAVAFGTRFVGVTTNIHSPNECYPLDDFYKLVDIYYDAFVELCNA